MRAWNARPLSDEEARAVKILVATDRSETARQAVAWAAEVRRRFDGQLVLLQVLASAEAGAEDRICADAESLDRARAVLMIDPDVVGAIVRAAEDEAADLLVVGNAGMGGRKKFLLGNVPNRVSHNARCTVVIVNTSNGAMPSSPAEPLVEGRLLGRAAEIGRVLAHLGLDVRSAATNAERASRLRAALEQLGPTFSKLGQLLSDPPRPLLVRADR